MEHDPALGRSLGRLAQVYDNGADRLGDRPPPDVISRPERTTSPGTRSFSLKPPLGSTTTLQLSRVVFAPPGDLRAGSDRYVLRLPNDRDVRVLLKRLQIANDAPFKGRAGDDRRAEIRPTRLDVRDEPALLVIGFDEQKIRPAVLQRVELANTN